MHTAALGDTAAHSTYPVDVSIPRALSGRNRLTTAFRLILAIPHALLVGGPIALALSWSWSSERGFAYDWERRWWCPGRSCRSHRDPRVVRNCFHRKASGRSLESCRFLFALARPRRGLHGHAAR